MDNAALFKLSYGLFVLTAREGEKDNGCIINTVMQITDEPKQIMVGVNKNNYTHHMIKRTGIFNISILTQEASFDVFRDFGFQSGREADKFAGHPEFRTANGIRYVADCSNAVLCGKVVSEIDCGTHTVFVAQVLDAHMLSSAPSVTYQYYFDHIKPKPAKPAEKKVGWVCKICGYVYEGEDLPADFICPLCKHGAADFEPIA